MVHCVSYLHNVHVTVVLVFHCQSKCQFLQLSSRKKVLRGTFYEYALLKKLSRGQR